ncbi:MAG: hypothetical protein GY723_05450 [bacterium]|nr:hypothetical protein [bacterium]MCP5065793.1 hypothetical protein [bacterium]
MSRRFVVSWIGVFVRVGALIGFGVPIGLGALVGCVGPRDPLADLHPVVWLQEGAVNLRTCRWPTGSALAVGLEGDASPAEVSDLDRALAAWSGAGLGLEIERNRTGTSPQIVVRFLDEPPARDAGVLGTGIARADCRRKGPTSLFLERAEVEVSRQVGPDWRGRSRPITSDERLGVLVHELGHALGFVGHVRAAEGPLVAAPEAIRRVARRVREGRRLEAPGLRALYARASGTRLRRAALAAWQTDPLDAFLPLAQGARLDGPWMRSGDRVARIFWRLAQGDEVGFLVPDLPGVIEDPGRAIAIPDRALRAWLEAGAPH